MPVTLYERSGAARWGLTLERLEAALAAGAPQAAEAGDPSSATLERHAASLHLEDLALAAACATGLETAWNHFVTEYQPVLRRAAHAMDPSGGAADLADELIGELYGLDPKGGARSSLFRYFHGRSRFSTWLRAVLAQRHVDRGRAARRTDPLPDDGAALVAPVRSDAADPERARFVSLMRTALAVSISALASRDRLRLGAYYAQDLTLAAIGRLLHEHEAIVSRHLARTRWEIRAAVEATLRSEHGMDEAAIAECIRAVSGDTGDLDLGEWLDVPDRKKPAHNRSRA